MQDADIDISVVIPTHRPSRALPQLLCTIQDAVAPYRFEIVLVDDGNDPSARDRLNQIARDNALVRIRALPRRCGQRLATLEGVSATRGRWVVTMDDDGEHPAAAIPAMIRALRNGADLVYCRASRRDGIGRRRASGAQGMIRRIGTAANNALFTFCLHKPVSVSVGSFRAVNGPLARRAVTYRCRYPYLSAMVLRLRPVVAEVRAEAPRSAVPDRRYSLRDRVALFLPLVWHWGPVRCFTQR